MNIFKNMESRMLITTLWKLFLVALAIIAGNIFGVWGIVFPDDNLTYAACGLIGLMFVWNVMVRVIPLMRTLDRNRRAENMIAPYLHGQVEGEDQELTEVDRVIHLINGEAFDQSEGTQLAKFMTSIGHVRSRGPETTITLKDHTDVFEDELWNRYDAAYGGREELFTLGIIGTMLGIALGVGQLDFGLLENGETALFAKMLLSKVGLAVLTTFVGAVLSWVLGKLLEPAEKEIGQLSVKLRDVTNRHVLSIVNSPEHASNIAKELGWEGQASTPSNCSASSGSLPTQED